MDQDRPGWNPPETNAAPAADVTLGAPTEVASPPRRSRIGTGVAVAAVGIGALGLVGTAYAATSSPSPSAGSESPGYPSPTTSTETEQPGGSSSTPTTPTTPGTPSTPGTAPAPDASAAPGTEGERGFGRHGHPGMRGGFGFGLRGPGMGIHGSFVTPKQGGGYQTIHTQRGTVTGVSSTSITVRSEDGYTKTYVVAESTVVNAQRDGIDSIQVDDEVMVVGVEDGDEVTAVSIVDRTRIKDGLERIAPPAPQPSETTSGSTP
jgi:hypothetical protein